MRGVSLEAEEGYVNDPFSMEIKLSLQQDRNSFIAAVGPGRSGKSYALMSIGESVDANGDFDIENHVSFLPQDFVTKMKNARKGCFVMFDETASEFGNRNFQKVSNLLISSIISTMNSRLVNIGFASTQLPQSDVNVSRALNWLFVMSAAQRGVAKLYQHWSDSRTSKFGDLYTSFVYVNPPFQDRPELLKEYEKRKKEYQSAKYDSFFQSFTSLQEEDSTRKLLEKYLEKVLENPDQFLTEKGKIDSALLSFDFKLRAKEAGLLKRLAERELAKQND